MLLIFVLALFLNFSEVSAADNQTDILNQSSGQDLSVQDLSDNENNQSSDSGNNQGSDQQSTITETSSIFANAVNTENSPTTTTNGSINEININAAAGTTKVSFTSDEVISAASWVKGYVDVNHTLPDYVIIDGIYVDMPSFLKLLTSNVLQINNGTSLSIDYLVFNPAPVPRDSIRSGDMVKAEYLKIAGDVKSFMDRTGVAPEYAYNASLGLYFGYQNMVYTYAKVLDSYGTKGVLPAYVSLKPWSLVVNPPVSFTVDEVTGAASWVKGYVETNHRLPDFVVIGSFNVGMSSFLELLATGVLQINNGTGTMVDYVSFGVAPVPRDSVRSGDLARAEYLKIAGDVKSFMDRTGVAPEYAYNTSLGLYFGYQNMVYTYAKVLDSYGANGVLPAYSALKPWRFVSDLNAVTFTTDQVGVAASWVKSYVETKHNLPDYVIIGSFNVSMSSFLELLTTSVLFISNNTDATVDCTSFGVAPVPRDTIQNGNIYTAEYLKIAGDVKSFMDRTGVAPEYAYNTSLGYYLGYQNLVYMYVMLIDYNHNTGKIAEYAVMKPWLFITNLNWVYLNGLKYYQQPNDYSCGPSALKMALSNFGLDVSEAWLEQVAWTSSEYGTSHNGLINAVSSVNTNYGTKFLLFDETFTSIGWLGLLNTCISKNCPVILHIQSFWNPNTSGHYVVLTGINMAESKVRIADPSAAIGYEFKYLSFSELEQRMQWIINTGRSSEPVMPFIYT